MHKKLEADLISLAHSILQMKNKEDVFALKKKSKEVYEKLSMLAFVEEYVNVTPNLETSKEELLEKVSSALEEKERKELNPIVEKTVVDEVLEEVKIEEEEKVVYNLIEEEIVEKTPEIISEQVELAESLDTEINNKDPEPVNEEKVEEVMEQPFDELQELLFSEDIIETIETNDKVVSAKPVSNQLPFETPQQTSLEEELQDTISVDVMADLFENAQPKSLNDRLAKNIQIGLNDRIAFVKNLFEGDQENYNRVISQLNTFKNEKEARKFIKSMVKPDYNWSDQEELEARFMEIIERKFA